MTRQWRRSDPIPEEAQQELREAQQRKPEAGQRISERYQRKTLPRIGPFQWVTTIRGKTRFSPLLLAGAAPRGGCSATGPLYPWFLIIARKSRAPIALAVVGKESGAWRRWRTARSRRHGRACPGHPRRPSASTQASAKSLATVRLSCPSRRGGTCSCGGPAWMAGTSPAMTARVRTGKPVDQHITP